MDKFREATRRLISDRGEAFLSDGASLGLLADYGAFEDDPAARDIFVALRDGGCLSALPGNWRMGSRDALYRLTKQRAFNEKKVYELLNILATECGADISELNPDKPAAPARPREAVPSAAPSAEPRPDWSAILAPREKSRFKGLSKKTLLWMTGGIVMGICVIVAAVSIPEILRTKDPTVQDAGAERQKTPHPAATFLEVQDEFLCGYRGGREIVPVRSDGGGLLACSSQGWCRVKGVRDGGVVIALERNPRLEERSCEVVITCDALRRTLKVTQGYDEGASYARISQFSYDNKALHGGVRCLDVSFRLDVEGFGREELTAVALFSVMEGMFSSRPMAVADAKYAFGGQCACTLPVDFRGGRVLKMSVPFACMEHVSNKWKHLYVTVAVYRKSGEGYSLVEKTGEKHYYYPDDYDWIIPAAEISRMELRHNVPHDGKPCLEIHSDVRISGMKGKKCIAAVFFLEPSSKLIRSANGEYRDKYGNLSTGATLDCIYDITLWKDLVVYMDNETLGAAMRRANVKDCNVRLAIYDDKEKLMAESSAQQIHLCDN